MSSAACCSRKLINVAVVCLREQQEAWENRVSGKHRHVPQTCGTGDVSSFNGNHLPLGWSRVGGQREVGGEGGLERASEVPGTSGERMGSTVKCRQLTRYLRRCGWYTKLARHQLGRYDPPSLSPPPLPLFCVCACVCDSSSPGSATLLIRDLVCTLHVSLSSGPVLSNSRFIVAIGPSGVAGG